MTFLSPAQHLGFNQFLVFGGFFLLGKQLTVIFRAAVESVEHIRQQEFVHLSFVLGGIGRVPQRANLGLKLGISLDNRLQHLAQIGFAAYVSIDVVVQFVIHIQEILQPVVRFLSSVGDLGVGARLFKGGETG